MPVLSQMTLCSIQQTDGAETLGVLTAGGIIDVRAVAATLGGVDVPLTLDQLLQRGGAPALAAVISAAPSSGVGLLDAGSLVFGRLFQHPGKIVCVGLNYRKHAQEIGMAEPEGPPILWHFGRRELRTLSAFSQAGAAWCVQDPCDPCAKYEVTACVPACCAGEIPCLAGWRKGFLGRKVLAYEFPGCGHCVEVVITCLGKTIVRD